MLIANGVKRRKIPWYNLECISGVILYDIDRCKEAIAYLISFEVSKFELAKNILESFQEQDHISELTEIGKMHLKSCFVVNRFVD